MNEYWEEYFRNKIMNDYYMRRHMGEFAETRLAEWDKAVRELLKSELKSQLTPLWT